MTGGRTLTVLVADVVESTRLNAGLGQEKADEVRRAIFGRFSDATAQHNGTLVKTMGDACLSTFNGATEAVSAGLEMIAAMDRLARQVTGLKLRVGVAVGDVTEDDGDVFGHAVVVASRLSKEAAPGQVLATEVVRELAMGRGNFEWERVGDLFLKGIEDPVATSAARARREETTRLRMPHALRARPGEVFVGRMDQLEMLRLARKEAATQQRRRAVFIGGEPGVGKTRLAAAAARSSDDEGALVLFARCAEDLAVPYQPFADALRISLQNAPSDLIAAHFEAVGGELQRLFPTLRNAPALQEASPEIERLRLFEAVRDFIDRLALEHPVTLVLDDIQWAAPATLQMLKHLVTRETPSAVCIVGTFRDSEIDRNHPLGEFLGDVSGFPSIGRISLEGLNQSEMEWLCEAASGEELDEGGLQLAHALHDRTSGNPFFATQVLRHWAEAGALIHGAEGWEARVDGLQLPDGVLDVVARRLARLSETTADTLSLAAVIGVHFTHAVLARAMGGEDVEPALNEAVRARILNDNGRDGYTFVHQIVRDSLLSEQTTTAKARRHRAIGLALYDIYGDREGPHVHDLAYHFTEAASLGDTASAAKFSLAAANECAHRADITGALAILERAWQAIDDVQPLDHESRFIVCNRLSELHYRRVDGETNAIKAAAESARALHSAEKLVTLAFNAYSWDIGIDDPFPLELVNDALAWMPDEPSVLRAAAFACAAYLHDLQSIGAPRPWIDGCLQMLADLGEPDDELARKARQHVAIAMIGQPPARRQLELMQRDVDHALEGFHRAIYLSVLAEAYARVGDRDACDTAHDRLLVEIEKTGEPTAVVYTRSWKVIRAMLDGRWSDVPALSNQAVPDVGVAVSNVASTLAVWNMWLAYEEGRSAEIIGGLRLLAEGMPQFPAMVSPFAVHLCEIGEFDEARTVLDKLMRDLPTMGRNASFGTILSLMAIAAAWTESADYAEALLAELDAFAGEIVILPAVVPFGSADLYRGMMLSLLGRHDEALAAIEAGSALERKLRAMPMVARSQYWLGRTAKTAGHKERAAAAFAESKRVADELGMRLVAAHAAEELAAL